ncbi:MAG: FAD-dependent oxidoreductase, partial [Planctomycetes bacterium]|nr:FAD-dependent oxidoreductase [Planctomycetota bacterium]
MKLGVRLDGRRHLGRAGTILLLFFALLACTTAGADERPAEGLVGEWRFDEPAGRLAADTSGQKNHAMLSDGFFVKGVDGTGLALNGQSTTATCPNSSSVCPQEALSIEAWIHLHEPPSSGFPSIVRKEESYALRFAGGRLGFLLWKDGQAASLISAKADWSPDAWSHVVATYDGARLRLFVDGREDAASPKPFQGPIDATTSPLGIGSSGSQHHFHGILDEVRLYCRALSADEIRASHEKGREALRSQEQVEIEPRAVGRLWPELRKPPREIRAVEKGFLWIDAEDFGDYGGWLLDTQFVHRMGSGYLIAAGVGTPVDDATVDVDVPQAGSYRLWVRAKNWLEEHSPGRFTVRVGGERSKQVFGAADTEAWLWQSAGPFQLSKGRTRIALEDLTGYYGRCDALILTTDTTYVPPNDVDQLQRERSRLTGLSLAPRLVDEFDVIVVGAGAAGGCAALASARSGAKTALIQNRPVLGGNASSELGVPICGASVSHPNARESGIIEEVGRIRARYGYPKMSEAFRIAAEGEENLSVFLNRHVFDVEMRDDRVIRGVKAIDTLAGTITEYRAKMFLDCTGDGWVGYYAGAEYHMGREGRDEFGESLAPAKPDGITMSGCLMGRLALSYRAEHMGTPTPYVAPPWAAKLPSAEKFGRSVRGIAGGNWWLEHPGDIDDLADPEKARDELIRISFGYWDYIKNAWPGREQAACYALTFVPITDAKRETRRLMGDYVLTQNDVQEGVVFGDRISYGGWSLDVHHPRGIFSGEEGPFDFNPRVPIYTIPLRCLYSKNVDNLLFAGRNASVSHVALGTVRVQGTLAALGQAAGTAAAMCLDRKTTPRDLYRQHIDELQQTLLKHDQYIPQLTNEDPRDLARTARVTASSTARYEPFGRPNLAPGRDTHPLNMPRAVMFPRGLGERFDAISLVLHSERAEPAEVTLHVRGASCPGDFSPGDDVAVAKAVVPPGRESLVEFPIDCAVGEPYVWIWLPPTDGIAWRLMDRAPVGSCRAYGGGDKRPWTVVE